MDLIINNLRLIISRLRLFHFMGAFILVRHSCRVFAEYIITTKVKDLRVKYIQNLRALKICKPSTTFFAKNTKIHCFYT